MYGSGIVREPPAAGPDTVTVLWLTTAGLAAAEALGWAGLVWAASPCREPATITRTIGADPSRSRLRAITPPDSEPAQSYRRRPVGHTGGSGEPTRFPR